MKEGSKGLFYYLSFGTIGVALALLAALRFRVINDEIGFMLAFPGALFVNSYILNLERKLGYSNKQVFIRGAVSLLLVIIGGYYLI